MALQFILGGSGSGKSEYVKKLAFGDGDPTVRASAKEAFDRLKDSVV